ncbi:MAG: ComEC family competence protein [Alcaligenaceae bacterium]|nr:MAG: ComEC family competence protein [Alcaligenaceae bacterium]
MAAYVALLTSGLVAGLAARRSLRGGHGARGCLALLLGACIGGGLAGARAVAYADSALAPAIEGRDVQVVGVVAQMPQHSEGGTRFRLDVESARWADRSADAEPVVPPRIGLGWYAANTGLWGRAPDDSVRSDASAAPGPLHAGERWRLTVRLKAPHGNLNPNGFDQELWLWEQGVQASGYVRTGARDTAPERIGSTWTHPVERARESVRDAVFERVADRRLAGVIAALVTGDQNAIERADWDVFRATGVAHLMSISGLHITYLM